MITLHLEAESAQQLRYEALDVLGIDPRVLNIEFHKQGLPVEPGDDAAAVPPALPAAEVAPEKAAPKPRGRSKKTEAPDAGPEVIDVRSDAEKATDDVGEMPAADAPETPIEAVRDALSKVIATAGNNPAVVFELIGKYKTADGKVAKKASELQPADRAKLIADVNAHLAKA